MRQRILVLGGGFAGLWSALGAARKLNELGIGHDRAEVVLVDRNPYHGIRVRNYEADLDPVTVPLDEVLAPAGIGLLQGEVEAVDSAAGRAVVRTAAGRRHVGWDRLVVALGSRLHRPPVPGLEANAFDVDTYAAARRLEGHLRGLASRPPTPGCDTVVVIGGGFTGLEVASEMPARLRRLPGRRGRVVLVDSNPRPGGAIGGLAQPVIAEALAALEVELRPGRRVAEVAPGRVLLDDGEAIATDTAILCAGMRASPLAASFPVTLDPLGRLPVDDRMRVAGLSGVFAAGDSAWCLIDGENPSVMSCQHGRPMGRFAGHNAAADLAGAPLLSLRIDWYVTVLDLGPWGALYTAGRERRVLASGREAKRTKQVINRERIYPPRNGSRADLFAAAAPVVQPPPPEVLAGGG